MVYIRLSIYESELAVKPVNSALYMTLFEVGV